jgi:hypothetical protein
MVPGLRWTRRRLKRFSPVFLMRGVSAASSKDEDLRKVHHDDCCSCF